MRAVVLIDETLYDVEDPHFLKGPPKRESEAEFFVCESLRTGLTSRLVQKCNFSSVAISEEMSVFMS